MNKTALITGAGSGIGRACALRFAREKYRIIATGRRAGRLENLKRELETTCNTEVICLTLDVRNPGQVEKAISGLPASWKNIDLLINNAGLALGLSSLDQGDIEDWDQMIDTNIKGLLYVSRAVIPLMKSAGRGHIINIGSIAGREVYAKGNVYCATKYAVNALSQGMRIDLLPYGIKVSQISPGAVETEFSLVRFRGDAEKAKSVYQGFTPLKGEDVAEVIFFAASLPEHVNINDLLLMPAAQASAGIIHRQTE